MRLNYHEEELGGEEEEHDRREVETRDGWDRLGTGLE